MLDQCDLVQVSASAHPSSSLVPDVPSLLVALLAHPDFVQGLASAHTSFPAMFEPAPLTEEEMMEEVEEHLSREGMETDRLVCEMHGQEPPSFFYNLGMLVGTIDKGLTYAQ